MRKEIWNRASKLVVFGDEFFVFGLDKMNLLTIGIRGLYVKDTKSYYSLYLYLYSLYFMCLAELYFNN